MPTVFDQIYEQLFGAPCSKEGEAFERLAAAATALAFPDADVAHNRKWRGALSQSLYQVDVLRTKDGAKVFGEAKDYTARGMTGGKVGRGDLQKLGGALPDVEAERGAFYSATGYTREATRYAGAAQAIVGRPIDLMHVRPSVEEDKNGRIAKIVLTLTIRIPEMDNAEWCPIFTPAGNQVLQQLCRQSGRDKLFFNLKLKTFYDFLGNEKSNIYELTRNGFGGNAADDQAHGCFFLPDHFISISDQLVELHGLEYKVQYSLEVKTLEIVSSSEPKILMRSEDGSVDRLFTEDQLRRLSFDNDGSVITSKA